MQRGMRVPNETHTNIYITSDGVFKWLIHLSTTFLRKKFADVLLRKIISLSSQPNPRQLSKTYSQNFIQKGN